MPVDLIRLKPKEEELPVVVIRVIDELKLNADKVNISSNCEPSGSIYQAQKQYKQDKNHPVIYFTVPYGVAGLTVEEAEQMARGLLNMCRNIKEEK